MTIPATLAGTVERFGDRPAVVDGGVALTYAELYDQAQSFGAALVVAGVRPGDRVAIWAPNRAEWIVALFGLAQAGAAVVPINTRFKGAEAADIIGRSKAVVLLTTTGFLGTDYVALLERAAADLPALTTIVTIDGPTRPGATAWTEFVATATADARAEVERRARAVTDQDIADIIFTSGTTGRPKGVVQTHAGTMGVARDWAAMTCLVASDRYLMINPYFHMFGLKAGILAATSVGATMVPVPVFDVDEVLQLVEAERITVLPGPPTLYQSILGHPFIANADLTSLRVAVTGAADIPVPLMRWIIDELPFELVMAGYGLTEGGTAAATEPGDGAEVVATTVGRPRPGFELRIVDAAGRDRPTGEAGEILLRSATIMSHYLDDDAATAVARSPDGWLATGDLGVLGEDGRLRIVGRLKDLILVGGFNAYPAEIESALLRHPEIDQAAVIGLPDQRLGEVVMAFVVPAAGSAVTAQSIIDWARAEMANFKVPRRVELVPELPINAAGKVEKLALRRQVNP